MIREAVSFIASIPFGCWTGSFTDSTGVTHEDATIHTHNPGKKGGQPLPKRQVLVVYNVDKKREQIILTAHDPNIQYGKEFKLNEQTPTGNRHLHPPYRNLTIRGCHDTLIGGGGRRLR